MHLVNLIMLKLTFFNCCVCPLNLNSWVILFPHQNTCKSRRWLWVASCPLSAMLVVKTSWNIVTNVRWFGLPIGKKTRHKVKAFLLMLRDIAHDWWKELCNFFHYLQSLRFFFEKEFMLLYDGKGVINEIYKSG